MEKLFLALGVIALLGSVMYISQSGVESVEQTQEVDMQTQFKMFKTKYNKKYSAQEDSYRLQVYTANVEYANQYNLVKGKEVFGETMFFDLTDEEFAATYLIQIEQEEAPLSVSLFASELQASVDWRGKGAVTPIKDQGQCGSCWAFSTTGAVEGVFGAKKGKLPNLSEQQLVDCAGILYGNLGCNGGMPARALNYVKSKGLTTEDQYPYSARKGNCDKTAEATSTYFVTGSQAISATEESLLAALQTSPVSVAVDANNWKYYDPSKAEVFSDCAAQLNHAVLAVGYGDDYVLVKNSWSTMWGLDGYIKLARGSNTCGVYNAMVVAVPK